MKIAIVTDKSRENLIPLEEARLEDKQKMETVKSVKEILSQKYECIDLTADENIIKTLKDENVDLVFNLCNGIEGYSKLAQLPAMLEFANIPYTGSSILGHALAINKIFASTVFKSKNIPTPDFISIDCLEDLEDIDMEYPILVKPSDEGSSRGIHQDSLVFNREQLEKKVKDSLDTYTPPIMLNKYIEGREFSIGIIGNDDDITILPVQEVDMSDLPEGLLKFNSFEVKSYYKPHVHYYIPARITSEEKEIIESAVLRAYKSLLLRDYARVDVILRDGIPYVLEINSLPGLMESKSSLYRMSEATDLGYEGLIFRIVDVARKRYGI
ncbi:MAG: ATP-grasp domain-containing protein [Tissierellaceae bacterium]|nr:ATP-grasp domain-containing protein [Tissierellaceae bacterium]